MKLQNIKSIEQMNELVASGEVNTMAKAIKAKCLDCSGYELTEVRNCKVVNCPMWVFRTGHRIKK